MKDFIDRTGLLQTLDWYGIIATDPITAERIAEKIIRSMPAVDAVEVTRCKDCARWDGPDEYHFGLCSNNQKNTREVDYCSYAAKK